MLYQRFPFLGSVAKLSKAVFGVEMEAEDLLNVMPEALEKARSEILKVLKGKGEEVSCDDLCSVLAYKLAIAVIAALGNNWLKNAFAVEMSKRASEYLKGEDGLRLTASILKSLGYEAEVLKKPLEVPYMMKRGILINDVYPVRMPLTSYVSLASRFLSDPSWKVVNKALLKGFIYLKAQDFVRLGEEAIRRKVLKDVEELGKVPPEALPEKLKELYEEVKRLLEKRASRAPSIKGFKGLVVEALPPCIKAIYNRALQGENLSHQERFTLATFLLNIGLDVDEVLEIFANMPDYNEKIARYQVEHLAGLRGSRKKYSPPSCKTLVSWNLCPGKEECQRNHPISEYYRRLKRIFKRKGERRAQDGEDNTRRAREVGVEGRGGQGVEGPANPSPLGGLRDGVGGEG